MKKRVLLFTLFFSAYGAMAQCTPDGSLTVPDIYPPAGSTVNADSTVNLPDGAIDSFYDQVIQVVIPSDTSITFLGSTVTATVDSFRLETINNIPPGLSYSCDNPSCNWAGGTNGCVRIFGTPTGPVQTYPLGVDIRAFLKVLAIPIDTIQSENRFKIQINNAVSLAERQDVTVRLFPNPASDYVQVELGNLSGQDVEWVVIDLSGRTVQEGEFVHVPGNVNRLELNPSANGIYLLKLATDRGTLTRRLTLHD
ncbi:T9SS type A sorting domain-containing protein [Cryomorphaceae bacterium]|nr:T9SS type A sorting domain-containing protein [Cryomorphaceae bacterium]